MLIAWSDHKEPVVADAALSKKETYHCPSCKSHVYLKAGAIIRPHFAHYQNDACDVFSEGETAEHLEGKLQLSKWLKQFNISYEIEAYLPELRQRPDLLVQMKNRKIALEFQCSPITIEKITERTEGYLQAGYEVIWILGEQFKYARQLTAFQKACLTKIDQQLVLFHYSVNKRKLAYHYNFQLRQNQKMSQSKRTLRLGDKMKLQLDQKVKTSYAKINIEMEHGKLLRQCQYPSEKTKQFLQLLYENKETIVSMPKELYVITKNEWMLQNYAVEWKFQFILWMEQLPKQTILTKRMVKRWLQKAEKTQTISYYDVPQLTEKQKIKPFYELIDVFVQSGVLKQIRMNKWTIMQHPKRYPHLEEKFA